MIQRYGVVSVAVLLLIPFYLAGQKASLPQQRTTPSEMQWPKTPANQAGSAMRPGTETLFVLSDGKSPELYSLIFKIPANTVIPPHTHILTIDLALCCPGSGISATGVCAARLASKPCLPAVTTRNPPGPPTSPARRAGGGSRMYCCRSGRDHVCEPGRRS